MCSRLYYLGTCKRQKKVRYYVGAQLILEASSFKYSGIITCSELKWADHVSYTLRKAWKALHFILRILENENNNTKCLGYTALVRMILEYGGVCWDPYSEGKVSALN